MSDLSTTVVQNNNGISTTIVNDNTISSNVISLGISPANIGLGNVDNTSDVNKPVSTAQQAALDLKANLAGATFTGAISATNLSGTNTGDQDLSGLVVKANNLSDLASATTARTNLGLGTAAVTNTGTGASNTILGNDSRLTDDRSPTAAGLAQKITAATSKDTPVDADAIPITDSAASFGLKKLTFTNLKAFLKTYLDTLYVALTGNQTIAGNKTFSGQTELTGQAATNGTSVLTRALADTRYGGELYYRILSSSVSYTNDATGTVILSAALPIGTYSIDAFIRFTTNAANSKVTPSILEGLQPALSGYRGQYANGGSPSRIAGVNTGPSGGGPWGTTANAENHERGGILVVTSGTNTYQLTAAQNTSSATTTTVGLGSYLIIRKIA